MARVTVACAVCGSPVSKAAWELRNGGERCCSRACAARLGKGRTGRRRALPREDGWANYNGYRGHYDAQTGSQVLEHREVMERHLGRPLLPTEHVDHINGDRADNRLENLQILTPSEHSKKTRRDYLAGIERLEAELSVYHDLFGRLPFDPSELSGAASPGVGALNSSPGGI